MHFKIKKTRPVACDRRIWWTVASPWTCWQMRHWQIATGDVNLYFSRHKPWRKWCLLLRNGLYYKQLDLTWCLLLKVNNAAFHYLFLSSDYMILRHCFQQSLDNRCAHIAHARARSWTDDAGLPANVREQSRDQRCRQRRRVRRRVTSLVTRQTCWTAAT